MQVWSHRVASTGIAQQVRVYGKDAQILAELRRRHYFGTKRFDGFLFASSIKILAKAEVHREKAEHAMNFSCPYVPCVLAVLGPQ